MDNRWCDMIEKQLDEVKKNQDRLWQDTKCEWEYNRVERDKTNEKINRVQAKLDNGISDTLTKTAKNVEALKEQVALLAKTMGFLSKEVYKTESPDEQLANCPYKKFVEENFSKKVKLYMGLGGLAVALVASLPAWIRLLMGA